MTETINSDAYIIVDDIKPEVIEVNFEKPEIIICTVSPTRYRK